MEKWLHDWFVKWHGEGEAHQAQVYRCLSCGGLITWNKIRKAEMCCNGRIGPTNPKWWEKVKLLAFPWAV